VRRDNRRGVHGDEVERQIGVGLARVLAEPAGVVRHVIAVAAAQAMWSVSNCHVLCQRLGAGTRVRAMWTPP